MITSTTPQLPISDSEIFQSLLEYRKNLFDFDLGSNSKLTKFSITLDELRNQQDSDCADILQKLQDTMSQRDLEISKLLDQIKLIKIKFQAELEDLVSEYVMIKKLGA